MLTVSIRLTIASGLERELLTTFYMSQAAADRKSAKVKLEVTTFTNYRQFLCAFMQRQELSYRGFARAYGTYVSFPFLSKLLRRDSAGRFVGEVNLKPEKLAALLRAMGLPSADISHLVLCRLKNDLAQGQYKYSATLGHVLTALKPADPQELRADHGFLNGLKALQPGRRAKVQAELRHQLEIEIARCTSPLKLQTLTQLLGDIKE